MFNNIISYIGLYFYLPENQYVAITEFCSKTAAKHDQHSVEPTSEVQEDWEVDCSSQEAKVDPHGEK